MTSALYPVVALALRSELDVVILRQRAHAIAGLLGLPAIDRTRLATAVSEVARCLARSGTTGHARFFLASSRPPVLGVSITGELGGPSDWLAPAPTDPRGAKSGPQLAGLLVDRLVVEDGEQPAVHLHKTLRAEAVGPADARRLADELMRRPPATLIEELSQQHQELLLVLEDLLEQREALRASNVELAETNRGVLAMHAEIARELDDTNRGVVALYAQLDDQARELQRVSALKDRFLSHLSHEFRTPLNSTLALTGLLLDRCDGPLAREQQKQVELIRTSASDLLRMVDDLLDLAKIEAGRLRVRHEHFDVAELFSALRGMLRPLTVDAPLDFVIEDPPADFPGFDSDRSRLAQILRNLLVNALQFTERGEVRLSVRLCDEATAEFRVADTGIGIAPDDLQRLFADFVQIEGPLQRDRQGSGLGLSLSRELATVLGGALTATSEPGVGSTFTLRVPLIAPQD